MIGRVPEPTHPIKLKLAQQQLTEWYMKTNGQGMCRAIDIALWFHAYEEKLESQRRGIVFVSGLFGASLMIIVSLLTIIIKNCP